MSGPAKLSAASLRTMIDDGMRVGEIAAATGYDRRTIRLHHQVHGIDPKWRPGRHRKVPPVAEIIARIEAGERAVEIARSSGLHPSSKREWDFRK